MADRLEDFLTAAEAIESLSALETAFLTLVRQLGFRSAAYYRLFSGGRSYPRAFLFGDRTAPWLDSYAQAKLASRDPRNRMALRSSASFTWREAAQSAPGADAVMEQVRRYATPDGLVTPVRSGVDEVGVCILYSDEAISPGAMERILLQGLCESFVRRGLQLLQVDAASPPAPLLTAREAECLHWVAAGYSDQEIAATLHRSANTIHTHVESMRSKLRARSRAHLVFKASMAGLVPMPSEAEGAPACAEC